MWIYGIRKLMLFLFQKKRKSENENPVVAFVHQQVERDSASGSVRVPVAAAQSAAVVAVEPVTPVRVADPGTRPKIVPIRPVAVRALPADRAGSSGTPAPTLSIVVATAVDEGVDVTSLRAPDSEKSSFDGPTRARRRCRGLRGNFLFPPRLPCRCSGARCARAGPAVTGSGCQADREQVVFASHRILLDVPEEERRCSCGHHGVRQPCSKG